MKMSKEQIGRTVQALIETKRHLEKELSYSEKHQKKDLIASYRAHIAKLEGMLSAAWTAIAA
jgi:hypothetical protein